MSITGEARSEQYRPRDPSSEVLYGVLLAHLETFLARIAVDPSSPGLPSYVKRELRTHLTCGILAHGFCRFHCFTCGSDLLIPFSCKGRGFCPSCGGRRMAESAAHLVDHVFPEVPVRQWVISFPWRLRYLLTLDVSLCRAVRRVFMRAVLRFYSQKAHSESIEHGRTGGINQIQRYGSALNANTHFHALVLDGVYTAPDALSALTFHPATRITDAEVAKLLFTIRSRVLRLCRRRGLMGEEGELDTTASTETQGILPFLCAASIQGRSALGSEPGAALVHESVRQGAPGGRVG